MAGLVNSSNVLQQWHHLFELQGETRSQHAQQHLQQMLRLGLPTRKHEDWKYTPLEGLASGQFVSHFAAVSLAQCEALAAGIDAVRLVFVDGKFCEALSDSADGSGFDITVDEALLSLPAPIQPEVFLHLTESLSRSVTHIKVKRNQRPTKPLLLMHITRGEWWVMTSIPRIIATTLNWRKVQKPPSSNTMSASTRKGTLPARASR